MSMIAFAASLLLATAPEPTLQRSIPIPAASGRIDHMACDPQGKRLYIAALENGSLEVIDLEKGERVQTVKGLKEPQGVAFAAATHQVFVACGGDGTLRAFDATTLAEQGHLDVGDDADNLRLAADGRTLAVGHSSGAVALLRLDPLKKTGEIKLPGHPESFQLDPASMTMFINVPGGVIGGGGQVIVADRATQAVTATWTLKEAGRNFPMALDAAHHRLYVGCRRPARLLQIDTASGKVLASPECVGDADDVFVDAATGRVVVIGGDGSIDVFQASENDPLAKAASIKTAPGARTGLLVPERRTLYLAVPRRSGQAAEIREYSLPD
jgi:DNA-binding beta-propeller fold protein YncE